MPVKAVALEAGVAYIIAMVCLSLAIDIAVDPVDWGDTFQPVYDALSDGCKSWVDNAARGVGLGYAYVFEWLPEQYGQITTEIINYFKTNTFSEVPGTVTPTRSDGKVGFIPGYEFSLYYPSGTDSCTYIFPDCTLRIYNSANTQNVPISYWADKSFNRGWYVINSDGFGCSRFYRYGSAYSHYGATFSSYWATRYDNPTNYCLISNTDSGYAFTFPTDVYYASDYVFFDSDYNYYILSNYNSGIAFVDLSDSSKIYNNLIFSDILPAAFWFYHSCGFATYQDTDVVPYSTPVLDTGVDFDETTATNARNSNLSSAETTGSVSTVIPSTAAEAQILVDNPSAVLDVSAAADLVAIYPDDLPKIDKAPALWQTKFPFCVPFDFARIIGDLQAPPEAPDLSFIILPENFFGLGNEAYYVDIDFSPFGEFISILRFFISLGFVLFLIILTREIIKG